MFSCELPCSALFTTQMARLYAQYRQAEVHRKALVFQKRYLTAQIDAFYQTQQAALMLMADMGAPVEPSVSRLPRSKYPRAYARFRAAVSAVIATLRFQYMRKRKLQYLRNKVGKISSSLGRLTPLVQEGTPRRVELVPEPSIMAGTDSSVSVSGIGMSSGIQGVLSNQPRVTGLLSSQLHQQQLTSPPLQASTSASSSHIPRFTGSGRKPPLGVPSTSPRQGLHAHSRLPPLSHLGTDSQKRSSSGARHKAKPSSKAVTSRPTMASEAASSTTSGTGRGTASQLPLKGEQSYEAGDDPHLMAYIKGLERLQTRLRTTKM